MPFRKPRSGGRLRKRCAFLTGKERDTESSNDYFGARYYFAANARWLSVDPVAGNPLFPQSLDRYAYVGGDPVNITDPTGMSWFDGYCDPVSWPGGRICIPRDPGMGPGPTPPNQRGEGGGGGSFSYTWGPYRISRYRECLENAKATMASAVSQGELRAPFLLPSREATEWLLAGFMASGGGDPHVLSVIWSIETDFRTGNIISPNRNRKREIVSTDYGPLQLNDYWKLDNAEWIKDYNPLGALNLKDDPWASFIAGVRDLADHGARSGDLIGAAKYWHGPKSRDIEDYLDKASKRGPILKGFFDCLKEQ